MSQPAARPLPLPEHLAERLRPVGDMLPLPSGELVLYWMHHAVRGHDNPALDTARHAAVALGLPLLVYQGLGGRHRFNADRHHAFILEGARDAHAELAQQGLRAAFHLPMDPAADASPLTALARRAALVVTEDFPAPPFPAWTARLAARVATPVWRVDSTCVVPMRLQPRRFKRAFELRQASAQAYAERLDQPWPDCDALPTAYAGPLPFSPLDLATADIPALCAGCAIDHSLPPIANTRGGAAAGYARWATFKAAGLPSYHRRRNDAAERWPRGVSRLSPYLHHGHVSVFRIAREAVAAGGEGAEKFLDELLIWRELAHNFCFHSPDPEAWDGLPGWARDTLMAHAGDPREQVLDHERLARGASGDRLWDLAQRSLLVHGELHNNLRMTWAKAIPLWTESPQRALAELIDLNHRHALDGSDPNSYGGLLWTLGLFDRPFPPERPVIGALRPRSTADHAKRLDLAAYARHIESPPAGRRLRIAVIGAGLAGLAAARALSDQHHAVTVFEKSRGRGGRAATRRVPGVPGGPVRVDHGAQYFTARDPRFRRRVQSWAARGVVVPWDGRLGRWADGRAESVTSEEQRWVAVPGMSALGGMLTEGLELRLATRVAPPVREADGWRLSVAADAGAAPADLGRFDRVLVGAPAPQAAALLAGAPTLAVQAAGVDFAPCWTLLLGLAEAVDLPWDGLFVNAGPLGWIARDSSKPARGGEVWVLHGTPAWSRAMCEATPDAVAETLSAAFAELVGAPLPASLWWQAHRWLYARTEQPLGRGCLWDSELGIGACGDWCADGRIEGAWLSGEALAGRLLGALAAAP